MGAGPTLRFMNTLFVENRTEEWQKYNSYSGDKKWFAGWAINYNAATNGLGYQNYDYVVIGDTLGDGESPMSFVKYIIDNRIKIGTIVLFIENSHLRQTIEDELLKNFYSVKIFTNSWEETFANK
jgi:hypothetical protein